MKKFIFITMLLTSIMSIFAQRALDKANYYSYGDRFYAESHFLQSNSSDSNLVMVDFKIVYDALEFSKVNQAIFREPYLAVPNVELIIKDSTNIIRKRMVWTDSIFEKRFEKTDSKTDYTMGYFLFSLPKGSYKLNLQIIDKYNKITDKKEIELPKSALFNNESYIGLPIFADKIESENIYVPQIFGDKINFSSSNSTILLPISYIENFDNFNYIIYKLANEEKTLWDDNVELSGRSLIHTNKELELNRSYDGKLNFKFKNSENQSTYRYGFLEIPLPAKNIIPGRYQLKVFRESSKDTMSRKFEISWIDQPLSLNKTDYALKLMQYILSDDEYDLMEDAADSKKLKVINDYWKKMDPTPSTPFNEAMATYFARADYAFFNYQTVKEKDGAFTERGKIHILFGAPDKIENKLGNNHQIEIWTYNKQNKQYIFTQESGGIYRLTEIK